MTEEITTEYVRAQFARQENYTECYEGDLFLTPDGQCSAAEFDCWLARVKAETLREFAGYLECQKPEIGLGINVTEYRRGKYDGILAAQGYARDHAAQIESEASNE
ncbi:hypothetical protein [Pseudoclavibacter soli]|uniref:hypothetical protein n=1 Tax=Pseudoclavibacter soli TaxID=452623 RepID=UPI000412BF4B|nr:hypothetical protein [Pseudoclavibacter soli]